MGKQRLEAFSDAVIAILLTIMVLELKVPHGEEVKNLLHLSPVFLSYLLSFIYIAIYWTNHHHMFQIIGCVNGPILWANMHLLFWLSMIPFTTAWAGENYFASMPVALYGFVLLMCSIAYYILTLTLINMEGKDSEFAQALGKDYKGKLSSVMYLIAMILAFWQPWIAIAIYVAVEAIWIIPDRRMERIAEKRCSEREKGMSHGAH